LPPRIAAADLLKRVVVAERVRVAVVRAGHIVRGRA
jgi:hypothetical protein